MTDDRKDGEGKVPSWQLPEERQPETDAYHIWTPRPLLRSIYWKPDPPPPPDVVSSTYEVFIDQRAWLTMHEHVWQTPAEKTPFGYLVGDLCEDPNAGRRFINITAALPARFDFHEKEREQISREATLALQLEVERRRGVLAGWYHRHLGGPVAMSESDVRTHHKHFTEPWHCAVVFVARRDGCEGGCFRSSPEEFVGDLLLPFYEMASNESLLARGVKRSYVDWANYTTVDEIRSEPPQRPTIEIPEPPEETSPEADAELQLEPFDADPDGEEVTTSDADLATEEEPDRTEEELAEPEGDLEQIEDDREPDEVDVDLDAAMDDVRPARIELDTGPEEAAEPETASQPETKLEPEPEVEGEAEPEIEVEAETGEEPADGELEITEAGQLPETDVSGAAESSEAAGSAQPGTETERRSGSAPSAARPAWIQRVTGDRRIIAMIVGGVLLLAATGIGFVMLQDGGQSGESAAGGGPAVSEPITAGETPGDAPAAATDSPGLPAVTAAQVDSAGQEMLQAISRFYGRAVARDRGEATCEELAAAFVGVEDAWIRYNTEYKAEFEGPLPDRLAQRDERLYAGVQDTEREFEASGCPRP